VSSKPMPSLMTSDAITISKRRPCDSKTSMNAVCRVEICLDSNDRICRWACPARCRRRGCPVFAVWDYLLPLGSSQWIGHPSRCGGTKRGTSSRIRRRAVTASPIAPALS
jgi:hypothetical protein